MTVEELRDDLNSLCELNPAVRDLPIVAVNTITWQFHDIGGFYPVPSSNPNMIAIVVATQATSSMPESITPQK